MKDILREALDALASGSKVALSTIVAAGGSLPMSRRSKMLVLPDGSLHGTVGGGCLEAEVYSRARRALAGGAPSPLLDRFVLTEDEAGAEGLNCGGTVEILTEALDPGPVERVLAACLSAIERREEGVLATSLDPAAGGAPSKIFVGRDGTPSGTLGEAGLDVEAVRRAASIMGRDLIGVEEVPGRGRIFLETILVTPTVVLFGGGHVSREVVRVARAAGFRVVVVDDRPAFASPERHPEADETLVVPFDAVLGRVPVDPHTYLVVVTRGHQHDEVVVRQLLRSPAAYIGMIGSGRKVALTRKRLAAEGFGTAELDRLHAPVGLDIGADTPGEIAVSIVAELVAVRRLGGSTKSLTLSGRLRV
jgi:xanthine dehydrogenase accessory factor